MNNGVKVNVGEVTTILRGSNVGDLILALLLRLSLVATATLSYAQSADYDEEGDLAILASNENARSQPYSRNEKNYWQILR